MTANSSRNPNPSLGVCYYPVLRVESLPEFAPIVVRWNSALYECHGWLEHVRTNLPPFIRLPNGQGVAYVHGKIRYLAILPDQTLLDGIVEELARAEHLKVDVLPRDIRSARSRGPPVLLQLRSGNDHPAISTRDKIQAGRPRTAGGWGDGGRARELTDGRTNRW
jgi:hypothetical protein